MSIGLVTIAALLLLLPGIGFIAGVNFSDKNIREIVFRNTPAEIGYVVLVSALVHLTFLAIVHFNVAQLYVDLRDVPTGDEKVSLSQTRSAIALSLSYFLATSLAGFVPGMWVGRRVRRGGLWRFFAKHRWMLDLAGTGTENTVYAQVLLKQAFSVEGNSTDHVVLIEGILKDSFFDADGTLLYLVFRSFRESKIPLSDPPYLGTLVRHGEGQEPLDVDQLVVEGSEIMLARYQRLPIQFIENPKSIDTIEQAIESNEP